MSAVTSGDFAVYFLVSDARCLNSSRILLTYFPVAWPASKQKHVCLKFLLFRLLEKLVHSSEIVGYIWNYPEEICCLHNEIFCMNIQVSITHPASPLLQQMTLHLFINLLSILTGWCEAESAPEYLWLLQGWFHESECQQPFPEASTEPCWHGHFISEFLPMKPPVKLPSTCLRCQIQTCDAVGFASQHEPIMRICVLRFIPEHSPFCCKDESLTYGILCWTHCTHL